MKDEERPGEDMLKIYPDSDSSPFYSSLILHPSSFAIRVHPCKSGAECSYSRPSAFIRG
jgi:hypothetical protein